ncbi:MAG: GHKL domain-containing protein [Desulfobulbaceae bacterium]|nr:GHKL domain-containing protein [Desulfobulbaceae bacterium]
MSQSGKGNRKRSSGTSKYRDVIISVALFLILDIGVLILNFAISAQIKQDAVSVGLAGRQQMLSQKIVKAIFQIHFIQNYGQGDARRTDVPRKELATAISLFEQTLRGYMEGKTVLDENMQPVFLPMVESDRAKDLADKTLAVWTPFRAKLQPMLASKDSVDIVVSINTIIYALRNDLKLLDLTSDLTFDLQRSASNRAEILRLIQSGGIVLALVNFFVLLFHFIGKLRERDDEIERYSQGLEEMVAARTKELRQSQQQLIQLNENLEQMVENRTKQLKESQTQLIQSEKMASLGQMVAGLAHEINTPLGYVRSNVEAIKETQDEVVSVTNQFELTQRKLVAGELDNIEETLKRNHVLLKSIKRNPAFQQSNLLLNGAIEGLDKIQDLILNLKNFSRLDEAEMKDADINNGIETALKIAHNVLKYRVMLTKEYSDLPMVRCYPAQLNQVFLNLLINAAQACENPKDPDYKGHIIIKTQNVDGKVIIEVTDNGCGIPEDKLAKIFEPFYTTKPVGKGTGLGLSIVYQIIERHNGKIAVRSKMGVGTTFRIELPVPDDAMQPSSTSDLFAEDELEESTVKTKAV